MNGVELWETDGTQRGHTNGKNIHHDWHSEPTKLILFNNQIYTTADDGTNGRELWVTDGSSIGTQMVKTFIPQMALPPVDFSSLITNSISGLMMAPMARTLGQQTALRPARKW
ncbi:MAG: hypothetical protein IPN22_10730 [Bacteroidetes bacterium]|nr:hypothetical protein [Bacteroidota bacterium]